MDMIDGQINLSFNIHLDREAQNEPEAQNRISVYKLKVAKRFEYIIFGLNILQYDNV